MHAIARVLAVAYVALAVFAGAVLVQITGNFVDTIYVEEQYGRGQEHVVVASVWLNWSGDPADDAAVVVNFSVRNPGRVAVEIVGVNYLLHVDWPEDPRPPFDPQKLEDTYLTTIGLSLTPGLGWRVPPGGTIVVSSKAVARAGSPQMDALNHPDAGGRFHPIVLAPWLVYRFPDFGLDPQRVDVRTYYEAAGVLPSG